MELLLFGHGGMPAIVFPTSCGRFFEFEDQGMVGAVWDKLEHGHLQLLCVDSVDSQSWYNRAVPPRWRIARQVQYQRYIMDEVVPLVRRVNSNLMLATMGCSFGAYHASNLAFRHPDVFNALLTMGGAFDPSRFLGGYYDDDCYFNLPTHYIPNMHDSWYLDHYRRNAYVLSTGVNDICRRDNEEFGRILEAKELPRRLDIWGDGSMHDWPWWRMMLATYI